MQLYIIPYTYHSISIVRFCFRSINLFLFGYLFIQFIFISQFFLSFYRKSKIHKQTEISNESLILFQPRTIKTMHFQSALSATVMLCLYITGVAGRYIPVSIFMYFISFFFFLNTLGSLRTFDVYSFSSSLKSCDVSSL